MSSDKSGPTLVSDRLGWLTDTSPETTREGTIVFLGLNRGLDRLIRSALMMSPYHHGHPSPWSHVVLLLEDYKGPGTAMAECTIRTANGTVAWDKENPLSLIDVIRADCRSGIFEGTISDYDSSHVDFVGTKWLPEIGAEDRQALSRTARRMAAAGYQYDVPGLLRGLIRLVTDDEVRVAGVSGLLSCTAFVAKVYLDALGWRGVFQSGIPERDITPDDLWWSPRGGTVGPLPLGGLP